MLFSNLFPKTTLLHRSSAIIWPAVLSQKFTPHLLPATTAAAAAGINDIASVSSLGAATTIVRRGVHSKRQIKRLFKGPRQWRIDQKLGIDRSPRQPPPPVEFERIYEPKLILKNGWSEPPPPDFVKPNYPFSVQRTKNKPNNASGFLPVYSKHRHDRTKIVTRIKKVAGDHDRFIQELRAVLQIAVPRNPKDDPIRIRAGGTVDVNGDYVTEVKKWLSGLGF